MSSYEENYLYFRGRCKAHGIDPDAEVRPDEKRPVEELQECDDPEPCEWGEPAPKGFRKSIKDTKQQMSGFFTPKQQRRLFRR
jgi:hypothetical protein